MLSPFETDLARRDPTIPGLAGVLDPETVLAELRRVAPHAEPRDARIVYVKYRPRDYCRVAYRLDLGGTEVDAGVRACRREDLGEWVEHSHASAVPGPLGPSSVVLPHRAVLVTPFPADLRLADLWRLQDATQRGQLLRELLPGQPELWQSSPRCLRYRPERRYAAELVTNDGRRALVKSYTQKAYYRGKRNALAFQSQGPLRVPRLMGSSDNLGLLAFEWLPGRLLMDAVVADQANRESVATAGEALAAVHHQDVDGLSSWSREAEAKDLRSVATEIGFVSPDLAEQAAELARRLGDRLAQAPMGNCPLHGDFNAKQVLEDGRATAVIDFDLAFRGEAAEDFGNFLAQAERYVLRGELATGRVEWLRDALQEGYRRHASPPSADRIGLYTAVRLFRRSRYPFRTREPDWPQRTAVLLQRAAAVLREVSPARIRRRNPVGRERRT